MGKLAGTGTVSGAIGGAAAVLAIAIFARTGTALEPQRASGAAPSASSAPPSPQTARPAVAPAARPAALVDFERDVQPILSENCLECHSQDKRKGGLSLATYGDVLDGGKDGAVVRPGRSSRSLMIDRVKGTVGDRMPLDELPLSDEQIALLQRWIDQGARATPTSAPAPAPWEAPLALQAPALPAVVWTAWSRPADRLVASYLAKSRVPQPTLVSDATFARRAYLDIWGLLPPAGDLRAFVADTAPDKRERLVARLLADDKQYAEHWISFWNDLLRNEDGQTYFSEQNGRKSITEWLMASLVANRPYDQFVGKLLNPAQPGDPEGFLIGVNWRGETSAAVMPWMQASQNTAQAFLGVNFKCNACHDSFVSKWKLKDAYGLAAYFSPEPKLQLFRCDIARDEYAQPSFFYPELGRPTPSSSLNDRRATAAAIFTDPRNGRMPRTAVNRIWTRLLGHGIVPNSDEMDGKPWSPAVLDWLASDFVAHQYDVKHLIATIMTSRAYQMPAVARTAEAPARNYAFRGPELRRLTAEQFADAIGTITGEWSISNAPPLVLAKAATTTSQAAQATAGAPARPAPGFGLPQRRLLRPRVPQQLLAADARARPAHSRPGHIRSRDRGDDVAVAGARERRDAHGVADARRAADDRAARRRSAQPVQRLRRRAEHPGADVRGGRLWCVEAVADHLGHRLQRAGTRAAGAGERGVRRSCRNRAAVVVDAGRRVGPPCRAGSGRRPCAGEELVAARLRHHGQGIHAVSRQRRR